MIGYPNPEQIMTHFFFVGYSFNNVHSFIVNRYCMSRIPDASKSVHKKVIAAIVTPNSTLTE